MDLRRGKLASPTSSYRGRKEKLKAGNKRYRNTKLFNAAALAAAKPETIPEQLLRNVAVAHGVAAGEHAAVIALVGKVYAPKVAGWAANYVAGPAIVTGTATWEQLYALTDGQDSLAGLRHCLADKSVNLRRASPSNPSASRDTSSECDYAVPLVDRPPAVHGKAGALSRARPRPPRHWLRIACA